MTRPRTSPPRWYFDETVPTGVDYREEQRVAEYDARHARFRDFDAEAETILSDLQLGPGACVIDMGAGTGAFAIPAARRGLEVHAVDVSAAMREHLRRKVAESGVDGVTIHAGGFLSYEHNGPPADAVVSTAVLHHLPDLWKQVALLRVAAMVRPRGRLYLLDVALGDDAWPPLRAMEAWVHEMGRRMGAPDEAETHLRDEFSTFAWVVSGMIERAGFDLDDVACSGSMVIRWLATRRGGDPDNATIDDGVPA